MNQKTQTNLNRAAMTIALGLAPAARHGMKTQSKQPLSVAEEVRQTLTCTKMRPQIQRSVEINLDNVCKTKPQLDYLTSKIVSNLKDLGVAD